MRQVTWRDHLRYRFDIIMAKGTIALLAWLTIVSALMIAVISAIVMITGVAPAGEGDKPRSFGELAWMCLMRTLDAGTMGGDTGSWAFLGAMLMVTFGGIFVVSTLIGILTSGLESRLDELRKGRSFVVETDHVVILGWSPHIFALINELVTANANKDYGCVVILADKDKVEMEDEVRAKVGSTKTTRVVCRTGSPTDLSDLALVNLEACRAVIVLAQEGPHADTQVLKTLMAIVNDPQRRKEPYHIVAELHSNKTANVAKLVGKDEVEVVVGDEVISRVTVQASRQTGLSLVYTELLDFDGDEIYFQEEPKLVGKTFGEAVMAYEDSTIIGIIDAKGEIHLNPKSEHRIGSGDKVIAVSEDDDTVVVSQRGANDVQVDAIRDGAPRTPSPTRTLILGWNVRTRTILLELDEFSPPKSVVTVVSSDPSAVAAVNALAPTLERYTIKVVDGDTTDPDLLESLECETYDHVMVLSHGDAEDPEDADARTLICLLYLRDIAAKKKAAFTIVSEMLDVRNRALAEATRADDFIVSDRLVSLLLGQLTENKQLSKLFEQLFDPKTAELSLRPAADYVELGRPLSYYTVAESARRRGQVALGYRIQANVGDPEKSYGVVVNPTKSERVSFTQEDRIVVLAAPELEFNAPRVAAS